jgi:hypothetical protein
VDVSGRHEEAGEYLMVAAAVHATVGSARIEAVEGMGLARSRREPTLRAVAGVVADAVADLPAPPAGHVVAEHGEFYEEPPVTVKGHLGVGPTFKYVESVAERQTVQAAHHAAYAVRRLVL